MNSIGQFPDDVPKSSKVDLLRRVDEAARSVGPAIVQVSAGYGDSRKRVLIANTDGVLADDEVVRVLMRISAVANGDTGMQTGFQSMGHTVGWEIFDSIDVEELARDAARQAITKLGARPAPSGAMPVVIRRAPAACCSTRRAGTGWRPTTSPRARACTAARSVSWSRRRSSRSSTTARCRASGARSASTTRDTARSATC